MGADVGGLELNPVGGDEGDVGVTLGLVVGRILGPFVGKSVGDTLGLDDGDLVGDTVGLAEDDVFGLVDGAFVGRVLGDSDGDPDGSGERTGDGVGINGADVEGLCVAHVVLRQTWSPLRTGFPVLIVSFLLVTKCTSTKLFMTLAPKPDTFQQPSYPIVYALSGGFITYVNSSAILCVSLGSDAFPPKRIHDSSSSSTT